MSVRFPPSRLLFVEPGAPSGKPRQPFGRSDAAETKEHSVENIAHKLLANVVKLKKKLEEIAQERNMLKISQSALEEKVQTLQQQSEDMKTELEATKAVLEAGLELVKA